MYVYILVPFVQERYLEYTKFGPSVQSRQSTTKAHGYVYHNKLIYLKQKVLQIV